MDYRQFGHSVVVRMDRGEEIVATLKTLCETLDVNLASVHAIGAVGKATIGIFRCATKVYEKTEFEGDFEIGALTGNVSRMDGATYLHLHCILTDSDYNAHGGHLNAAFVSGTCELVLHVIDGEIDRAFSDEIGLNLIEF
jgi:predicted DNA-binding protein with PD1-like motif